MDHILAQLKIFPVRQQGLLDEQQYDLGSENIRQSIRESGIGVKRRTLDKCVSEVCPHISRFPWKIATVVETQVSESRPGTLPLEYVPNKSLPTLRQLDSRHNRPICGIAQARFKTLPCAKLPKK